MTSSKSKTKKHPSRQNIKVAIDSCIFTIKNRALCVLLIQMKKKPFSGCWALPGGLIRENETLDRAAKRILKEETNVKNVYQEQLYTFSDLDRDPFGRVISCAYFALIPDVSVRLKTIPKYKQVRWRPFNRLPRLAYDHNKIACYAKKRLQWKIGYTNVVWSLLAPKFTFSQLQGVYEVILGRPLDKRNFRKKILSLNLISPAGKEVSADAHRPAMLYQFKSHKPRIVEIL